LDFRPLRLRPIDHHLAAAEMDHARPPSIEIAQPR
jgi:hypothetical protein